MVPTIKPPAPFSAAFQARFKAASSWVHSMRGYKPVSLSFATIDFYPRVKWKERHALRYNGHDINHTAFIGVVNQWAAEQGLDESNFLFVSANHLIFFKEKNMATMFKLIYDGFDKY